MKLFLTAALALAVAAPALAQDAAAMSGMNGMSQSSMATADGAGIVRAVDPQAGTVTIQHGPIAGLKWPAMTMAFKASSPSLLHGVTVGQTVKFKLMQMGGAIQLTAIQPN
jgi:Cu(I)/Ag(I) efflux system protein CusF